MQRCWGRPGQITQLMDQGLWRRGHRRGPSSSQRAQRSARGCAGRGRTAGLSFCVPADLGLQPKGPRSRPSSAQHAPPSLCSFTCAQPMHAQPFPRSPSPQDTNPSSEGSWSAWGTGAAPESVRHRGHPERPKHRESPWAAIGSERSSAPVSCLCSNLRTALTNLRISNVFPMSHGMPPLL